MTGIGTVSYTHLMADKKDDIVLSIRGMSKSFGRNRVLDHINLELKRGTVMGLMGENGAGKSTMMKCLLDVYKRQGSLLCKTEFLRDREKWHSFGRSISGCFYLQ